MDTERGRGLVLVTAGLTVVVLAVLLFGLTTDSGEADWVSIITAVAGAVMVVTGLYIGLRRKETGTGGSAPRSAP